MKNRSFQKNLDIVTKVCDALLQGEFLEEAGDLCDSIGQTARALECYRSGACFEKAIQLAKKHFQGQVVTLEEEWGDYLVSSRKMETATNHFIEAGCLVKALDAALESRQWKRALSVIEGINDVAAVSQQWNRLGEHFYATDELSQAEKCFMKAGNPKRAVEMYTEKGSYLSL